MCGRPFPALVLVPLARYGLKGVPRQEPRIAFCGLALCSRVLAIAERNWKLKERDRMGLLLVCCVDPIGAVSIEPFNEETDER